MLQDAGWTEGRDWVNEYPVEGMPNASGRGFVDYVLLGDDGSTREMMVRVLPEPVAITSRAFRRFSVPKAWPPGPGGGQAHLSGPGGGPSAG